MNKIIELLTQISNFLGALTELKRNSFFSVIMNERGNLVAYLRPETGADYCSMSISNFKLLLKEKKIRSLKVSEKITLIRVSDIDTYIEEMENINGK